MSKRTVRTWRWAFIVLAAISLIGLSALATYLVMKSRFPATTAANPTATASVPTAEPPVTSPSAAGSLPDLRLTLTKEAIDRAGIVVSRVSVSSTGGGLRVPAVAEPNAYRSIVVTPVVAGRLTAVSAQLGQQVRRGQSLAQVHSPELAETQSRYVSARAELDAHERELRRTEKLVELGSASRQELETIHAEHTAAVTMVQSLRSRLTLLGASAAQMDKLTSTSVSASVTIPAPMDGVITARDANVGQNVDTAAKLFTVVDLSTVWLVGSIYERDLGRVRVGSPVTITTPAYPTMMLSGKVSYLDPQLNPDTRTAQLRVELPNQGSLLRFGMYAEMQIGDAASAERLMVPRAAVQIIGDRSVIYLADSSAAGRFIEREVRLGMAAGDQVEIVSGAKTGDAVVVEGSFALRAERDRLGLRPAAAAEPPRVRAGQIVRVIVSEKGFEPARIALRAGLPARLTFERTTDATCATEIVIPSLNVKRALPLNQRVDIELTPEKPGDVAFACGMGMFSGTLVVQ